MKYLLFLVITLSLLAGSQISKAQTADTLYLHSTFWGNKFYKADSIISVNQVLYEMAPNESVYNLMKSAKTDFVFSQILGATGGLLIGWPLGTAIAGGEPNWVLAGIGAGIVAISIPISINFKKKATAAIKEHNSLITSSGRWNYKPVYNFGISGSGLSLKVRF